MFFLQTIRIENTRIETVFNEPEFYLVQDIEMLLGFHNFYRQLI